MFDRGVRRASRQKRQGNEKLPKRWGDAMRICYVTCCRHHQLHALPPHDGSAFLLTEGPEVVGLDFGCDRDWGAILRAPGRAPPHQPTMLHESRGAIVATVSRSTS